MFKNIMCSLALAACSAAAGCDPLFCGGTEVPIPAIGAVPPFTALMSSSAWVEAILTNENVTVRIARTLLGEPPGMATYTLATYNPGSCPPAESDKVLDFGTVTDDAPADSPMAWFSFRRIASDAELQLLDGKMLFFRALDPSREPKVDLACTGPVRFSAAHNHCHVSN